MIPLIRKIIEDKLPGFAGDSGAYLSFLKYSTPASGRNLNDKVIFLVFKPGAAEPFLCVKTVRNYAAKEVVARNFSNLKKLNMLTAKSPYSRLFARALYLHDDGENVFSIETACPGRRIKLNKKKLSGIVAEYVGFQEYLAKRNSGFIDGVRRFAEETVAHSGLEETDKREILRFMESLPFAKMKLPRLIQHGDITEDNILMSKSGLHIVDCDFVGITDLPGFDLFGLFFRFNCFEAEKLCYEYLPEYFKRIGADLSGNGYEGLFFLYYFIERALRKTYLLKGASAGSIISDFKKFFPDISA